MSPELLKANLRKQLSGDIAELPDEYITGSDEGLLRLTTMLDEFRSARNIMIYHSVEREPATPEIAKTALAMGKTVAFPYCYRGGIMNARIVGSLDELRPAMLGIPAPQETAPIIAPEELDLIIVPALTYDRAGYRLGYGGGYYDRYLCGVTAFMAGMARSRLITDELPRQPHDIAVDCVITEDAVMRITRE